MTNLQLTYTRGKFVERLSHLSQPALDHPPWTTERSAGYDALTSRNPSVRPERRGAPVTIADQRDQEAVDAFRLRSEGMTYRQISEALGVALSTVHERVRRAEVAAGYATAAGASAVRRRLLAEADGWASRLDAEYAAGRVEITAAIRVYVPLAERIARLAGADMPTRLAVGTETEVHVDPDLVAEVNAQIEALKERERARALDPNRDDED
jgi:DNA-binding Lrp family transcriptional regulator